MRKYIYIRVEDTHLYCTDPSTLDWIVSEVKRYIPSCIINGEKVDLEGAKIEIWLDHLQHKDRFTADFIIRLLCENGFEPFQEVAPWMHFRKLVEG